MGKQWNDVTHSHIPSSKWAMGVAQAPIKNWRDEKKIKVFIFTCGDDDFNVISSPREKQFRLE